MADNSYNTEKTFFDANCDTNNNNEISGADLNDALTKLLQGLAGKLFDDTKPYKQGQMLVKQDATFGFEIWVADDDTEAGSWDADNFTRLLKRTEKITASDTPYTGIEQGTKQYSHNLGHVDFIVQAFSSSGEWIPISVTSKTTTKVTIASNVAYPDAVIYVQEIVIP